MLRDHIKNGVYFTNYIIYQNQRIEKFSNILAGISDEGKIVQCNRYIANFYRDLLWAKYSIGASKTELQRVFERYMQKLSLCKIDSYSEMIDVLSLAYLLDSDQDISAVCGSDDFSDGLTLTLKNILNGSRSVDETDLRYATYYMPFYQYLSGKKTFEQFESYMKNEWYRSSCEAYWHDSHLSNENVYVGYWSWLAAAVLKATGTTSQVQYVPADII